MSDFGRALQWGCGIVVGIIAAYFLVSILFCGGCAALFVGAPSIVAVKDAARQDNGQQNHPRDIPSIAPPTVHPEHNQPGDVPVVDPPVMQPTAPANPNPGVVEPSVDGNATPPPATTALKPKAKPPLIQASRVGGNAQFILKSEDQSVTLTLAQAKQVVDILTQETAPARESLGGPTDDVVTHKLPDNGRVEFRWTTERGMFASIHTDSSSSVNVAVDDAAQFGQDLKQIVNRLDR